MKKLSEKGRKVLRMIYRGLGVTAVSLIFSACYGMPPDGPGPYNDDVRISGSVQSKKTGNPIRGIHVSIVGMTSADTTSSGGYFYVYVPRQDYYTVKFEDIDGPENDGQFRPHEIIVSKSEGDLGVVKLEEDE